MAQDFIGETFGRWEIIASTVYANNRSTALARCSCGTEREVNIYNVRKGKSTSCGCYRREQQTTHGGSSSRLYGIWRHMRGRCHNPEDAGFKTYGARGIAVCDEWRCSFEGFQAWSLANGYADNLEIDRRNNNGNYEPSNCRWVDGLTNRQNTRQAKLTPSKLALILVLAEAGKSQRWIGGKVGVNHNTVGEVLRGQSWANVVGGLSPRPFTSRLLPLS